MATPKTVLKPAARKSSKVTRGRTKAMAPQPTIYSVHPGITMIQKWAAELPAKTGCTLERWIARIRAEDLASEQEARRWLKETHKLGTNTAWWLVEKAFGHRGGLSEYSPEAYLKTAPRLVDELYSGPKAGLRPIHEELVRLVRALGSDVRICPCKTMVPLYRRHVFAAIKPATSKRIDLGFALGEEPFTSRLIDTGGRAKKDRITHRVALTSLGDIDLQVKRWLKQAYEGDA